MSLKFDSLSPQRCFHSQLQLSLRLHSKHSEIEVTRVSSFLCLAYKRPLLNLGYDHSRIVTPLSLTILNRCFSLKAVAFHHGLMANNEHYTCLVEAANGWLMCNDEVVSPVSNASEFLA